MREHLKNIIIIGIGIYMIGIGIYMAISLGFDIHKELDRKEEVLPPTCSLIPLFLQPNKSNKDRARCFNEDEYKLIK